MADSLPSIAFGNDPERRIRVIRKYSEDRENDANYMDANGRLLHQAVRRTTEDYLEEHPADSAQVSYRLQRLKDKKDELKKAQMRFIGTLDCDEKKLLQETDDRPRAVMALVEQTTFKWLHRSQQPKDFGSKLKSAFRRCCSSLNQHSEMFEIVPSGNEYVSIISGTVKVILQASGNYQMVAENLPSLIDRINDMTEHVLCHVQQRPKLDDGRMLVVLDFYVQLFTLWEKIMRWCIEKSSHRLFKSSRRDCYTTFKDDVDKLQNWCQSLHWKTVSDMDGRIVSIAGAIQSMATEVEEIRKTVAPAREYYRDSNAEPRVAGERSLLNNVDAVTLEKAFMRAFANSFRTIGHHGFNSLVETISQVEDGLVPKAESPPLLEYAATTSDDHLYLREADRSISIAEEQSENEVIKREAVQEWSSKLEDWYPPGHIVLFFEDTEKPQIGEEIETRLADWMLASTESRWLYLEIQDTGRNDIGLSTQIAARAVACASALDYPIVSYFCSLPRGNIPAGRIAETIALCELMAALIRQLTGLLPSEVPTDAAVNLQRQAFESLDGTLRTWEGMLQLFDTLLSVVPTPLLIVIDSLEWLSHGATVGKVAAVMSSIRRHTDERGGFKVLLTTAQMAPAVVSMLRQGESYELDEKELQSQLVDI